MSSQEATEKVLDLQHKLYAQGLITTMPQLQVQFKKLDEVFYGQRKLIYGQCFEKIQDYVITQLKYRLMDFM